MRVLSQIGEPLGIAFQPLHVRVLLQIGSRINIKMPVELTQSGCEEDECGGAVHCGDLVVDNFVLFGPTTAHRGDEMVISR